MNDMNPIISFSILMSIPLLTLGAMFALRWSSKWSSNRNYYGHMTAKTFRDLTIIYNEENRPQEEKALNKLVNAQLNNFYKKAKSLAKNGKIKTSKRKIPNGFCFEYVEGAGQRTKLSPEARSKLTEQGFLIESGAKTDFGYVWYIYF